MNNIVFDYFRANLREIRKEKDLTAEELSKQCQFDRTYIGKIERGEREPSLHSISRICQTLNCSPSVLFSEVASNGGQKAGVS